MAPSAITPIQERSLTGKTRLLAGLVAVMAIVSTMVVCASSASATTTNVVSYRNAVFALINQERAANHLPRLAGSAKLNVTTYHHNLAMASRNQLSHQISGEPSLGVRLDSAGFHWTVAAENIAWTSNRTLTGALNLQKAMYNEKAPNNGHRVNMLSRSYTFVGVSVLVDSRTGKIWLTTDFGR